jgi:hypothetical protein
MPDYGIEWLRDSTRIHTEGTFDICPELFFQAYILFGITVKVQILEYFHVAILFFKQLEMFAL